MGPTRRPKSPPRGVVTTMFTDIANSTKLKSLMQGDTSARRDAKYRSAIMKPHDQVVVKCIERMGGHLVKSTGDGYYATFPDAEEAVLCALEILDLLNGKAISTPLGPLQLRIGLHTGIADPAKGDYIAATIDKTARVQSKAEPGQVLVSRETHALVAGKLQNASFENAGSFELKGLSDEELYRVLRSSSPGAETTTDAAAGALGEQSNSAHGMPRSGDPPLSNPYEFDSTAGAKTFKGRELEIAELVDSIQSSTHTAIFGLQRMGKTSLIDEGLRAGLERHPELARTVLPVMIDMQQLGGDQVTYRELVQSIIHAITEKLASLQIGQSVQDLRGLTNELFAPSHYQPGNRAEFFSMLGRLLRGFSMAAHRRIILFIDEFSELRKVIERNNRLVQRNPMRAKNMLPHDMHIDVPFLHHLSSLLRDRELKQKLTIIVLVRPFMAEYDEREELQLLKLMKPIMLYHLEEQPAKALITEPLEGQVAWDSGTVGYLYQLTAGHPYLLQFILKVLVDRIRREGRRNVTMNDIAFVERRMISEGPAYDAQFEVLISDYSVDEVTHPKEALLGKGLLALIAKLDDEHSEGWVDQNQLFSSLLKHKVPYETTASLLSQMTRTKILEENRDDHRLLYRISIPLLQKRFVEQNVYLKYFR